MITNYFSPLEFNISVKRLPNVEFFAQRVTIPGISSSPVIVPSPVNKFFETPDELQYNNLDLSFIIDENMKNYIEVFNWMTNITFPQSTDQFKRVKASKDGLVSDISITVLNSHKNPNVKINFKDCFPISLSEINMDTTNQDVVYPEASVTFQYNWFEIVSLRD
jgi:hypothetical protein